MAYITSSFLGRDCAFAQHPPTPKAPMADRRGMESISSLGFMLVSSYGPRVCQDSTILSNPMSSVKILGVWGLRLRVYNVELPVS